MCSQGERASNPRAGTKQNECKSHSNHRKEQLKGLGARWMLGDRRAMRAAVGIRREAMTTLDIVRRNVGRRSIITPEEMVNILRDIHAENGKDSLANSYVP